MDYVSATQLTTYLMCPIRYRFRYIDRIPPAFKNSGLCFGSAVHTALGWLHEAMLAGEKPPVDEVVRIFNADWQAQLVEDVHYKRGENPERLRGLGQSLVTLYCQQYQDIKVAAVEKEFTVPLIDPATGEVFDRQLRGYMDVILEDDLLLELKTAGRAYSRDDLNRNLQLSAYAYAYRQLYGTDPKVRVVALLKQKVPRIETYSVERPSSCDRWFVHVAGSVAHAIDAGAFPPCPSWACSDCEYGEHCQNWFDIESPQQSTAVSAAVNF